MYRGTFAIIDEAAIRDNVAAIRGHLGPHVRMLVAVKANGYGHGMLSAAGAALAGGADYLGVATLEEALELRHRYPAIPILVLGAIQPAAARKAAEHQVDVTVTDDWSQFAEVPRFAAPLRVHLKVDSGMTRLGFRLDYQLAQAAGWFRDRDDIQIQGVYSHLAWADGEQLQHARQQVSRFEASLMRLRETGIPIRTFHETAPSSLANPATRGAAVTEGAVTEGAAGRYGAPPIVHIANSAAALRVPEWHYDMVRVGISAYGLPPGDSFAMPVALRQAMNLYSFITRVVEVEPGETVGYGATFTVTRTSKIATVPIGYGDGYPRHLSNQGYVLVRGRRAPVVGNVCMDQLMIDVTDINDIKFGDCVTLYGIPSPEDWNFRKIEDLSDEEQAAYLVNGFRQARDAATQLVSIHELAKLAGTISYELATALTQRVPHLYTGVENHS